MDLLKLIEKEMNDLLVDSVRSFRDRSGNERTGTYLLALLKAVRSWHAGNQEGKDRRFQCKTIPEVA